MTENAAEPMTDRIVYRLNQPAAQTLTVNVAPDLSLVDTYNATNKTDLQPLPATAVTVGNGGALTVAAGKSESEPLEITFSADGLALRLLPAAAGPPKPMPRRPKDRFYIMALPSGHSMKIYSSKATTLGKFRSIRSGPRSSMSIPARCRPIMPIMWRGKSRMQ